MERLSNLQMAQRLARAAEQIGGRAYFVGGYVRDTLLGKENKDIDIEVHGLTPNQLETLLDSLGERMTMGVSFGIYGLKGYDLDIAMPRLEHATGRGHRDFSVFVDPFVGVQQAAKRRDFTINAMLMDVLANGLRGPFHGQEDLKQGVLRHIDSASFVEDPLRVLRAAQFAARFHFTVADITEALCASMELKELSRERVMDELQKVLLKAEQPSIFFRELQRMQQLDFWFPELQSLIGVPQNPRFHREGDVWEHTLLVLDEAASLRETVENPLALMLAALTHDMGKPLCTEEINGVWHAYGHESLGLKPAESFLKRLTREQKLIRQVLNLTELHMKPNAEAAAGAAIKTTNRLFDKALDPGTLLALALADHRGSRMEGEKPDYGAVLQERLIIYRQTMAKPCVTGTDLLEAGLKPGPIFSEALAFSHKLRLAGVEKESALKQTLARYK
ncbi:MAG: HD domain-containing protein [Oscillospiraceae bacterium]|nr:HD domain-containing protein [Oscillospiraceae bacterium]